MVVSAAESFDVNKKPLTFMWVVLRGDEKKITITPKNKAGSEVEIVVPYHPRRPVTPGSPLESNRVDIGVFVHNGTYYSAPGFITFCTLDNESRGYDEKGRILDIGYGAGEVDARVSNHGELFKAMTAADGLPATMFKLTVEQRDALAKVGDVYGLQQKLVDIARMHVKEAETIRVAADKEMKAGQARVETARKADAEKPSTETKAALEKAMKEAANLVAARKKADAAVQGANKETAEAQKKVDDIVTMKRPELNASVNEFVDRTLRQVWQHPELLDTHGKAILPAIEKAAPARKNLIAAARQRLIQTGLATKRDGGLLAWQPIRMGSTMLEERLTPYEKQVLERFNATLLAELVLPGALTVSAAPNFVDQRLYAAKSWRDVFHYNRAGKLAGWTRYDGARVSDFTDEGLMVLEKDGEGRAVKARSVRYQQVAAKEPGRPSALEVVPGDDVVTYAYEGGKRVEKSRMGVKKEK
jgi:hypothetical protein